MYTELVLLFKVKNNVYNAVYCAGNGKAHNDWYQLFKRASSDEEALEWAKKVVLNSKWASQYKVESKHWLSQLFGIDKKNIIEPTMAGQDYGVFDEEGNFLIDGGFEIDLACEKPGKCKLTYNAGTRGYPEYKSVYLPSPHYYYFISFGAGRSNKETVYIREFPKNVIYHAFRKV